MGYLGFQKLEGKLGHNPKIRSPGAVAHHIEEEKYGKATARGASKLHISLKGAVARRRAAQAGRE